MNPSSRPMTTPATPDSKFPNPRYLTTCEHATSLSEKASEFIVCENVYYQVFSSVHCV
ncbi:hypothetical protein Hanom_Chr17g01571381 [Helianthus anomalus]